MLSSQRDAVEFEANVEPDGLGGLEGHMEGDANVAKAYVMYKP